MKELTMQNGSITDATEDDCDHTWIVSASVAGEGPTRWTCANCYKDTQSEPDTYRHPHETEGNHA